MRGRGGCHDPHFQVSKLRFRYLEKPKVIQLGSGETRIQTQECLAPKQELLILTVYFCSRDYDASVPMLQAGNIGQLRHQIDSQVFSLAREININIVFKLYMTM